MPKRTKPHYIIAYYRSVPFSAGTAKANNYKAAKRIYQTLRKEGYSTRTAQIGSKGRYLVPEMSQTSKVDSAGMIRTNPHPSALRNGN